VRGPFITNEKKKMVSLNKSWRLRGGMEFWASVLTLTFGTTRTAELSALRAYRTLPPKEIPWYSFLLRGLVDPSDNWMRTEEIRHLKTSKEPTVNRTRNLPSCGAVLYIVYVVQIRTVARARQRADPLSLHEERTKTVRQWQCNLLVPYVNLPLWTNNSVKRSMLTEFGKLW
jgi:hypothetical protein